MKRTESDGAGGREARKEDAKIKCSRGAEGEGRREVTQKNDEDGARAARNGKASKRHRPAKSRRVYDVESISHEWGGAG